MHNASHGGTGVSKQEHHRDTQPQPQTQNKTFSLTPSSFFSFLSLVVVLHHSPPHFSPLSLSLSLSSSPDSQNSYSYSPLQQKDSMNSGPSDGNESAPLLNTRFRDVRKEREQDRKSNRSLCKMFATHRHEKKLN